MVDALERTKAPLEETRRRTAMVVIATDKLRRTVSRTLARVPFDVYEVSLDGVLNGTANLRPNLLIVECGAADPGELRRLVGTVGAPIMLVGADREEGLKGLEAGTVVDFVQTPVWERELRARAIRRADGAAHDRARRFGDLHIDLDARTVLLAGRDVALTRREFELIVFLSSSPGVVFTRRQLLEGVWGSSSDWQQLGTVTEHIYRLRRKLERDPSRPQYIVTVPRTGYSFGGALRVATRDRHGRLGLVRDHG